MSGRACGLALGLAWVVAACEASGERESAGARVSSAIIHGTDSDASEDAVVLVMHLDLILGAYAKAGQDPWREGEPDPATLPPKAVAAEEAGSGCSLASPRSRKGSGSVAALALAAVAACVSRRRTRS